MGKLDELKALVRSSFEKAEKPEEIKASVDINNAIGAIEKEFEEKDKSIITLRDAYQEALKNQGVATPSLEKQHKDVSFETLLEEAKKIK